MGSPRGYPGSLVGIVFIANDVDQSIRNFTGLIVSLCDKYLYIIILSDIFLNIFGC